MLFIGLEGTHSCINSPRTGDWSIKGKDKWLYLPHVIPFLIERDPVVIAHWKIAWKYENNPMKITGPRYNKVDLECPGIVVAGASNPKNKPFRMIDGAHRMAKMKLTTDYTASYFYVLSSVEFHSVLQDNDPRIS